MTYKIEDAIKELKKLAINTPKQPKKPSKKLIKEYEERISYQFPKDYKKFLRKASTLFYGTISPLIITEDGDSYDELSVALKEARMLGVPENWLPFCEDNGDYYCLLDNGEIRFWSHDGCTDEKWNNLATWVKEVWIEGN